MIFFLTLPFFRCEHHLYKCLLPVVSFLSFRHISSNYGPRLLVFCTVLSYSFSFYIPSPNSSQIFPNWIQPLFIFLIFPLPCWGGYRGGRWDGAPPHLSAPPSFNVPLDFDIIKSPFWCFFLNCYASNTSKNNLFLLIKKSTEGKRPTYLPIWGGAPEIGKNSLAPHPTQNPVAAPISISRCIKYLVCRGEIYRWVQCPYVYLCFIFDFLNYGHLKIYELV